MDNEGIRFSRFAVDDRPFCVWEWDLEQRNTEFIDTLDPGYFEYVARFHVANIDGDDARRAAVSLRTSYAHGLESFFALLFACFQAPDCVPGWLARYQLSDLRALVKKVHNGRPFKSKIATPATSWDELAAAVHGLTIAEGEKQVLWRRELGYLWGGFARDFLDEEQSIEYNSLKHGFRVSPGGFSLRVGFEPEPGIPPPPEEMIGMGSSRFGSTYFKPEALAGQGGRHFRIRRQSRNWIPENHYHGLRLLSGSMSNIINFLKILRGADPVTTKIRRPENLEIYRYPWRLSAGTVSFNLDTVVSSKDIKEFTAEEVLDVYNRPPAEED
jgi:hypothetical protein